MANSILNIVASTPIAEEAYRQIAGITSVECPDTYAVARAQNEEVYHFLTEGQGKVFLGNAFFLQMVSPEAICTIQEVYPEEVPREAVSVIGHPDTAAVVSDILGREVPCNRTSISLGDGDVLYVAQLMGGRLPEGATKLPKGFYLAFRKVTVRC